jgi:hypothetical protein
MAVARPHRVVFSCCYGEMTAVAVERATRRKPSTRSEATMCWVKLPGKSPRHPGRARALPLCGPWPRPHLAAAKLVELRSSVNLVAMPYQPLDRPVASLTNPGLRDVRYAHIAPPRAILGAPRCGCRGESQRAGDTNPGCLGVASSGGWPLRPALAPLAWLAQPVARPACGIHQWINRKARSASGTTCVWQGSLSQWHDGIHK